MMKRMVDGVQDIRMQWIRMMRSVVTMDYPRRMRKENVVVNVFMYGGSCLCCSDSIGTERNDWVGEGVGVESLAGQQRVDLRLGCQSVVQQH